MTLCRVVNVRVDPALKIGAIKKTIYGTRGEVTNLEYILWRKYQPRYINHIA